ncbi:MAG TPA: type III-B CRISPR module-associated protein Cmr3 [Thermodesulfobacteriota bacterium]|nr:type III-B CRISPR module-associated protein Cmr3 [Thermodesulfobacteriota bacterium]
MRIFIEPLDVVLFRDGKPFSAEEDIIASSIFPPFPSTFYGAMRTETLSRQNFKFQPLSQIKNNSQYLNQIDSLTHDLRIVGPFIADENHLEYFPIPKDIVEIKGQDKKYIRLKPTISPTFKSDLSTDISPLWVKTNYDEHIEDGKGFISESQMKIYLEGRQDKWSILNPGEVFHREERVGIKRPGATKTSEEGFFYIAEFVRLNSQFGFTLDIEGNVTLSDNGFFRLGGESRAASYRKIEDRKWEDDAIKKKVRETRKFKLYLLSHAIFEKGWIADWMHTGEKDGLTFKLISACVGKPVSVGGFDIVENRPKPMKKAVPAGSVYFFELLEGNVDELFKAFQFKSISDEKQKEGFGITLVGGWNNV